MGTIGLGLASVVVGAGCGPSIEESQKKYPTQAQLPDCIPTRDGSSGGCGTTTTPKPNASSGSPTPSPTTVPLPRFGIERWVASDGGTYSVTVDVLEDFTLKNPDVEIPSGCARGVVPPVGQRYVSLKLVIEATFTGRNSTGPTVAVQSNFDDSESLMGDQSGIHNITVRGAGGTDNGVWAYLLPTAVGNACWPTAVKTKPSFPGRQVWHPYIEADGYKAGQKVEGTLIVQYEPEAVATRTVSVLITDAKDSQNWDRFEIELPTG